MPKLRGRLINFRVTDDEFEQLKTACDRNGASCLSAFARKVMLNAPDTANEELAGQVAVLERRLAVLEDSLSRIFNVLSANGPGMLTRDTQFDAKP